jgi:cysteine desulfurase/selenocysteine lyase
LIGTAGNKASVQSFLLDDIHPHDLGTILDHQGVAIRTGHHCAMPVMEYFSIPGTARASLALYNNTDDVDRLIEALLKAKQIFA